MKRRSALLSEIAQIEEDIKETLSLSPTTVLEELELLTEKLSLLRGQFETTAERQHQLTTNLSKAKEEQESARVQLEAVEEELEELSKEFSSLNAERKETEDTISKSKVTLSRLQEDMGGIRSVVEDAEQTAKKMRAEADKLGEEVFSERSPKVIDDELTQVTARLSEAQKRNIDPSKVNMELKEHQDSYERSRKEVLEGELLLNDMRHGLDKRERVMEGFRKNISQESLVEFIVLLSARGFSGSLDYHHQLRELHLSIRTDGEQNKPEQTRDIKQLSGGEKSFGTTCFLLSLWGSIGAPLRCLDEFDVFMDAVNRRIVMDMLVEHARQRNFQFILITPIPLNDFLAANPDIHVVRMKEPGKNIIGALN